MRLDQKIAVLGAQPFLSILEPEALHVLAFSGRERVLKPGEELVRRGEATTAGYVVLDGRVTVSPDGINLADGETVEPGGLIGQRALLIEGAWPGTAVAVQPSVLLEIPRALMRQVLETHPTSAASLRASIAAEAVATHARLSGLI